LPLEDPAAFWRDVNDEDVKAKYIPPPKSDARGFSPLFTGHDSFLKNFGGGIYQIAGPGEKIFMGDLTSLWTRMHFLVELLNNPHSQERRVADSFPDSKGL